MSINLSSISCSLPVYDGTCFSFVEGYIITAQPVWSAPQNPANPYQALAQFGVKQVVCVRDPQEITTQPNPFDVNESLQVVLLGMAYDNAPLAHVSSMTQQQFNVQAYNAATVYNNAARPTLIHCSTGDRASAAFAVFMICYLGYSNQDACNFAMEVLALANPQFVAFVQNFSKP